MDAQCLLSRRSHATTEALQQFGFRPVQNATAPRVEGEAAIDLSVAENWCIRSEIISLFQDAVLTGLNDRVYDSQRGEIHHKLTNTATVL
jgi:hypothetical protein